MTFTPEVLADIRQRIPENRVFNDPVSTLAFGTDASFYRLIPKVVVRVQDEAEVVDLLAIARRHKVPVTFRAAGTSLSGQAISDSILIVLGDQWNGHDIREEGRQIRLQPGVIGAQANAWLAPKFGPSGCKVEPSRAMLALSFYMVFI